MTVRYYFDQHMPGPITRGLRRHSIDVLTTQDDNTELWEDERLLARAYESEEMVNEILFLPF